MRVRDIIQRNISGLPGLAPLCVLALVLAMAVPGTAFAGQIIVTTTVDLVDGDTSNLPALRLAPGADGLVSLREAVLASAGEVSSADIILSTGTYVLESGSLDISASVRIFGAGSTITPKVPLAMRIFDIDPALRGEVTFELSNATLSQGRAKGAVGGGALRAGGTTDTVPPSTVALTECTVIDNRSVADTSTAASGGALNIGRNVDLTLRDCTFSGNYAEGVGGALFVADSGSGSLNVGGCTFDSNTSDGRSVSAGQGGAIYARVADGRGSSVATSTFTNNVATSYGTAGLDRGGALFIGGDITIRDSRISHNTADEAPGAFGFLGTPDAEYNWWGTNSSPTTSAPVAAAGGIDADPWLRLTVSAGSTLLTKGDTTAVAAQVLSAGHMPPDDGALVTFAAAPVGSVSPAVTALASGLAGSIFSAEQVPGLSVISATYDGVVATVGVGIAGPPAIMAASEATFTVGMTGSVDVSAQGYPVPTLSLQGALPSGLSFSFQGSTGDTSSAGVILGEPAAGSGGRYAVSIVATNGAGPDASAPMTITVLEAPKFLSAASATFTVGTAETFDVSSSAFPTATITALDALPDGLTLVDDGDGTARVVGTPAVGSSGAYSVRLRADNGVTTAASQVLAIVVTEPLEFSSGSSVGFVEGVSGHFAISVNGYPVPSVGITGALPAGMTFTDLGAGSAEITGTPSTGSAGMYPVTLTADNGIESVDRSFSLTVDGPPTAVDHVGSCPEDGKAIVGLLVGASDPNGDPLSAELVSPPSNGALTISSSGTATYTPDADFNGTDTFTYRVSGTGSFSTLYSAPATVTITIAAVNDAPTFTPGADVAVDEDSGAYSAAWASAISAGPADESAQALGFVVVNDNAVLFASAPALASDGTLTFTPAANVSGSAEVTVTLTDDDTVGGAAKTHTEKFTITVGAVNDAPSFTAGTDVAVDEDSGAYSAAWASAISAGPADEIDQTLTFGVTNDNAALFASAPAIAANGTLTFTPAADVNGAAEVTVVLTDDATAGGVARSTAPMTFTITVDAVSDSPIALEDAFGCSEDASISANVLDNDSDADGDTLTAQLIRNVAHGVLEFDNSGELTYTPAADWSGVDTFTYRASDGLLLSAVTTVTITVTEAIDVPVALDDAYATDRNVKLVVNVGEGVLANDLYVDSGVLQAALEMDSKHGKVKLAADGSFTYTPDAGYWGSDEFLYRAHDGASSSQVATVTIAVDHADSTPPVTKSNARTSYVSSASIALSATDDITGVAWTKYQIDASSVRTGSAVSVTGIGTHTLKFWSEDNAGNLEAAHTVTFTITKVTSSSSASGSGASADSSGDSQDTSSGAAGADEPVGEGETGAGEDGSSEDGSNESSSNARAASGETEDPAADTSYGNTVLWVVIILVLGLGAFAFIAWRRRRK